MSRAEDPIARAERLLAELREATGEAAGLVTDLRKAAKEARALVEGYYMTTVQADLERLTEEWDHSALERIKAMVTEINRVAANARDKAESAIDTALTIEGAAEALAALIAQRVRETPAGRFIHYGDLIDPDAIELNL